MPNDNWQWFEIHSEALSAGVLNKVLIRHAYSIHVPADTPAQNNIGL